MRASGDDSRLKPRRNARNTVASVRSAGNKPSRRTERMNSRCTASGDPDAVQREFMRSVLREGLFPALRTDATVFRAFLRGFNLLSSPEALMQDSEVMAKVLEAYQTRDEREPDPP